MEQVIPWEKILQVVRKHYLVAGNGRQTYKKRGLIMYTPQIKISKTFSNMAQMLRPYAPFTSLNVVWRSLDKGGQSILDVGCGKGATITAINKSGKFKATGLDIFEPSLKEAMRRKVYQNLVMGEVEHLPFKDKSFDIVICMEVLEHLEKGDGERLLIELERVTRRQVLLTTPVGKYEQHASEGNIHWEHKYIWSPSELKAKGYSVKGTGLRGIGGEGGWGSRIHPLLKPVEYLVYGVGTMVSYNFPNIACHMVAKIIV